MIDGQIKGDGTSRFLKSYLPDTYNEFKALMESGQLPVDVLFNPAGWRILPTFLNKNALLKDETAVLYGLTDDAVPDDVLALIKTLIDNGDASANKNANIRAKIESGSYTGTNDNKTKTEKLFTASFPIKVVIVSPNNSPMSIKDAKTSAFAFAGTSTTVSIGSDYGTYNLNYLGTKYNYVVLG